LKVSRTGPYSRIRRGALTAGSKDTATIATRLKKPWMHISKADSIDPPEALRLF